MEVADLLKAAGEFPTRLALVTGGEPLWQEETLPLLAALADAGWEVCLETNGSRPIAPVDVRVHRILDLKCPGSGMAGENYWPNPGIPDPPGRSQICGERSPRFSLGAGGDSGPRLVRAAAPADFPRVRPSSGSGGRGLGPGEPAAPAAQSATAQIPLGAGSAGR